MRLPNIFPQTLSPICWTKDNPNDRINTPKLLCIGWKRKISVAVNHLFGEKQRRYHKKIDKIYCVFIILENCLLSIFRMLMLNFNGITIIFWSNTECFLLTLLFSVLFSELSLFLCLFLIYMYLQQKFYFLPI